MDNIIFFFVVSFLSAKRFNYWTIAQTWRQCTLTEKLSEDEVRFPFRSFNTKIF